MQEEGCQGGFKREGPVVQSVGRLRLAPSHPPEPPDKQHPETIGMHSESQEQVMINIWLLTPHFALVHTLAMIDSGADGNFMDRSFALRNKLPLTKKQSPISVVGIDGRPLVSGNITEECQVELLCKTSDSNYHVEGKTTFSAISSPNHDVILGLPWLRLHHPSIDWKTSTLSFNSEHCSRHCEFLRKDPLTFQNQPAQSAKSVPSTSELTSVRSTSAPKSVPSTSELKSVRSTSAPKSVSSTSELKSVSSTSELKSATLEENYEHLSDLDVNEEEVCQIAALDEQSCEEDFSDNSDSLSQSDSEDLWEAIPSDVQQLVPPEYADYLDVFSEAKAKELPPHRPYDCAIELVSEKDNPPCGQIYPLSPDEDKLMQEYISENLACNFIRPSTSSAGASVFFVEKEKGKTKVHGKPPKKRLVVNYKGLDKLTKKFRYPLPLIETMFDQLHSAKVFTKIDLRSAYNLLRIREGDEWKTAFRTKYGLFEYLVMPFGLANAPAYFQRFVNDTFANMKDKFVVIYLDDFLIYSPDEASHREHVRAVLQRLRENRLFAKAEKCQFSVPALKFLGYHVSAHGRRSDEDKVKAVKDWPTPRNRKEVQCFIGLANYLRKFIEGFSKMALPLNSLLKKGAPFEWNKITQQAFENLKKAISSAPVLMHVDQTRPIWIETDASDFALGCILMQKDDNDQLKPCAFYSRGLEPAEINYSTHDKELLAIKVAFGVWRHYLEGAPHQITVISDHQGLEQLDKVEVMNARHARWSILFKRFNFVIKYRPGKKHNQADALSRRPDFYPNPRHSIPASRQRILGPDVVQLASVFQGRSFSERVKRALPSDAFFQDRTSWDGKTGFAHIKGILYFEGRLYVPEGNIRLDVLKACHDSRLAGHLGQRKTLELVTRSFWWPALENSVKQYCETCNICVAAKSSRHKPHGLLMPLQAPEGPWTSISMDFIVELPESAGMTAIFVVVDRFTKMVHFVPTRITTECGGDSRAIH